MKNGVTIGVVLAVLSLTMGAAHGYVFGDVDVEAWIFSSEYKVENSAAENAAIVVIDFAGDGSYAFGYRWKDGDEFTRQDNSKIGSEMGDAMMLELEKQLSLTLAMDYQYYGSSMFMKTLTYDTHTSGGDYPNDWLSYWTSTDGETWTAPPLTGVSDTILTDGAWHGWGREINNTTFDPANPPVTPTPEPATMLLLGGMAAPFVLKRRRRK